MEHSSEDTNSFRVMLESFSGPLDLLLYLVRKHEMDILDLPIAVVLDQYLESLAVLQQIDIDVAGDFLATASLLMEIKSRELLPGETVVDEPVEDPRQELVRHLLAYKEYADSAGELERRSRQWQQRYPRLADDLPRRTRRVADEPIAEVELWDLVSAFGRLMRDATPTMPQEVVYDDTPISTHMNNIYRELRCHERLAFRNLFTPDANKSTLIGIFLALLALVRHNYAAVRQDTPFGEIDLTLGEIRPNSTGDDSVFDFTGMTA